MGGVEWVLQDRVYDFWDDIFHPLVLWSRPLPPPIKSWFVLTGWGKSLLFLGFFFFFFFFGLFVFLEPHLQHMEVPRLGVKLELQLLAYTTATATWDPSHICNLYHSSRQRQILNPLSEARDRTCIVMDTSQIRFWWAMTGTPKSLHFIFFTIIGWNLKQVTWKLSWKIIKLHHLFLVRSTLWCCYLVHLFFSF